MSEKYCDDCLRLLDGEWRLCTSCRTSEQTIVTQQHIAWCFVFMAEDPTMTESEKIIVFMEIHKCQDFISGLLETA